MGLYLSLLSISVEHAFFADGACKALDFVPTPKTAALLHKTGLLTRATRNGISIFCEDRQLDDLRRDAADAEKRLTLSYKVFPGDPYFGQYTYPGGHGADEMLYFDSTRAAPDAAGRPRLHDGEYVSETSLQKLDSPVLREILDKRDHMVRPGFIVDLALAADGSVALPQTWNTPPHHYYLSFAARQSVWKYYFLGDLAKKELVVSDLDNKVGFERIGTMALPGNRMAQMFISSVPIPMREAHDQRFQLKEKGPMGEKVLIKRLPNAAVSQINREVVGGKAVLVSEMYVN